jgi:LacI family transcriptional regulator
MGSRPTIEMIAQRANVSRGTVDRVLNDRSYVRGEVRQRVLDAIRELGYVSPRQAHERQLTPALEPLRLGVLLPNWGGYFRAEVDGGIARARRELADFGVEILVRCCATDLPEEAVGFLDQLRREGCRGLAVCALSDSAIESRVSELAEAGIPCVTFNSDLPGSRRLCCIGQDIRQAGRVAGELMSRCVAPGARVLATLGNLKFDGHRQRLEGFCQRMAERGFPREQIAVAETFNDYAVTLQVVGDALAADPGLSGVYMANLNVTACAEAVRRAGLQGRVRVICHDENESIRRLLQEGSVDFTIPQDMARQSYLSLLFLRELLQKGRMPDPGRYASRISVVCAENLLPSPPGE